MAFDLGKHYGQETVNNKADIAVLRLKILLDWRQQGLARFEPFPFEQRPESIIHGFLQVLLTSQITLGGQN